MKTMNKRGAKRAADFVVQGSILAMAGILVCGSSGCFTVCP